MSPMVIKSDSKFTMPLTGVHWCQWQSCPAWQIVVRLSVLS